MSESKIEWTDATWNPVRGCVKVSPGCKNCYAETFAERWRGIPGHPYEQGFNLRLVPEKLTEPLKWKKPRRVFVNSMSDLFQDGVPDEFIDRVFAVMALTPQHTYQVLTKRPERMLAYFRNPAELRDRWVSALHDGRIFSGDPRKAVLGFPSRAGIAEGIAKGWRSIQLENVWLGVSCENQDWADKRIPFLLQTPAAVRFVSYEPALGPIDFKLDCLESDSGFLHRSDMPHPCEYACGGVWTLGGIDWIIVGGESGPGSRPFDIKWARSVVQQCNAAGVACFVKQVGARPYAVVQNPNCTAQDDDRTVIFKLKSRKGGDPEEWPEELRVRQFPISQIGAKA